jgi:hypothetical protein
MEAENSKYRARIIRSSNRGHAFYICIYIYRR